MMTSLRSKWAAGKAVRAGLAVRGRISRSIRNRRATQPPAHFQRNPLGRGQLAVFPRCSLGPYAWALRSRLEKQPTDLRRRHHYMRDGTLMHRVISRRHTARLDCNERHTHFGGQDTKQVARSEKYPISIGNIYFR